jgi:DNA-binding transcriptional MerR regulator
MSFQVEMYFDDDSRLLTSKEVARMLNMRIPTVRKWGDSGMLTCIRKSPHGWRRFLKGEVSALQKEKSKSN